MSIQTTVLLLLLLLVLVSADLSQSEDGGGGVLKLEHKFGGLASVTSLEDLKKHDLNRHERRLITAVPAFDFPLDGGQPISGTGLYYTNITVGSPPEVYHFHVDTATDAMWFHHCCRTDSCPSNLPNKAKIYNLQKSSTSRSVHCDEEFCHEINKDNAYPFYLYYCSKPGAECETHVAPYGEVSHMVSYLVNDLTSFTQISGNKTEISSNSSVTFGCRILPAERAFYPRHDPSLDGVLGFSNSSTSVLSQLVSSGKIKKKKFAHCLDRKNGGGVFVIGDVDQPELRTTSLFSKGSHYHVNMKSIKVGDVFLKFSEEVFPVGDVKGTVIDSSTTMAYFPVEIFDQLYKMVMSSQQLSGLETRVVHELYTCFSFDKNVDDSFPTITFTFDGSTELKTYPHEYLFQLAAESDWCLGLHDNRKFHLRDMIVLGDLVLSNKVVSYDLDTNSLGLAEHDCASTIGVKDDVVLSHS
ncbi:hypothetical protein MKW98_004078 [Papaver atlanticum]|uniref:Peptidase A1 domain-containing protein n=1 Tax=Papaver atlanticum TaxID=357466 RepID=A0AAD4T0K3_9MAGN|nr:hypothetical protein MKW98_004078 [Papaver atlanticum]